MKILVKEKISEHRYKTPEGYLICVDSVLARTGKQTYQRNEVFHDDSDMEVEIDRSPDEVFSEATLASFENKPLTVEHPDEDVNIENYRDYAVGFVRDIKRGMDNDQEVMLGTLVITDAQTIEEIENGEHTDLSCGYDCDIADEENPQQRNIRGNHVALCREGRAGVARIVDSVKDASERVNKILSKLGRNASLDEIKAEVKRLSTSEKDYSELFEDVMYELHFNDSVQDSTNLYYVEFTLNGQQHWTNVRANSEEDAMRRISNSFSNAENIRVHFTKTLSDSVHDDMLEINSSEINEIEQMFKQKNIKVVAKGKTIMRRLHYQVEYNGHPRVLAFELEKIDDYFLKQGIEMTWSANGNAVFSTAGVDFMKWGKKSTSDSKLDKAVKIAKMLSTKDSVKDASKHEIVSFTENTLREMGYNNSIGKYDRVVFGMRNLFGESLAQMDDEFKAFLRKQIERLLVKYNLKDSRVIDDKLSEAKNILERVGIKVVKITGKEHNFYLYLEDKTKAVHAIELLKEKLHTNDVNKYIDTGTRLTKIRVGAGYHTGPYANRHKYEIVITGYRGYFTNPFAKRKTLSCNSEKEVIEAAKQFYNSLKPVKIPKEVHIWNIDTEHFVNINQEEIFGKKFWEVENG